MFFSISKTKQSNYTKSYKLDNGLFFNCDHGWNILNYQNKKIFYKGYVLHNDIENVIKHHTLSLTPRYKGNFSCIICDRDKITITHDIDRGFPIFSHKDQITNLIKGDLIYSNMFIDINSNLEISYNQFKNYSISNEMLEYEIGLKKIHFLIKNAFDSFLSKNKNPIKIFLSGGIDTLLAYSFLKKSTKNFELVNKEYVRKTNFYLKNKEHLVKFWGYNQMHSWGNTSSVLVTGGCGDEYMMRNPIIIKKLFDFFDIDFLNELKNNVNAYHFKYFNREKNLKIFQQPKNKMKNLILTKMEIFKNLSNDHQHWHLDGTTFFTPFKDLEIPNLFLQLPKEKLLEQALDAKISKDLISLNDPNDLKLLSKYKNS